MKAKLVWAVTLLLLLGGTSAFSGDLECYQHTSTTSHFDCNVPPYNSGNCTWWAAYKRPDVAAVISGSGWNGGQWYGNLVNEGFDVGSGPKVGAIAAFSSGQVGHVAYVESLGGNGSFGVSEMDAFHSTGFTTGVNYATYYPGSGNTYHRNTNLGTGVQGYWTLQGFIYRRDYGTNVGCDMINSIWGICWTMSSTDVSCQGGEDWTFYDFEQSSVIRYLTNEFCLKTGGIGGGPGYETLPTDTPEPNLPDFIVKELWLENSSAVETYTFDWNQTVTMRADLKNIGEADWAAYPGEPEADDIYVKFYLSNGYKEDAHSEWIRVGNEQIQKGNLDVGVTKHEYATLDLSAASGGTHLQEGVYNIVVCVDRKYDQNNGDGEVPEMHKSNNCSTEAVFTVTVPNFDPVGWVDSNTCAAISGWALDDNAPGAIYVDMWHATSGGAPASYYATLTANIYRADVGSHGFSFTVPPALKDGATRYFNFYGINVPTGTNPLLSGGSAVRVECALTKSVFRLRSPVWFSHFYTISEAEKNSAVSGGWIAEGVGWHAFDTQKPNTVPLYRLWTGHGHFYTTSLAERNTCINSYGWLDQGVAMYVYAYQHAGTSPVYRLRNAANGNHFYTISYAEMVAASGGGYIYEGVAFWAYVSPQT